MKPGETSVEFYLQRKAIMKKRAKSRREAKQRLRDVTMFIEHTEQSVLNGSKK